MAKKRVIAYYMHETEQNAAVKMLSSAEITDSFAIGDIEEADENELRKQGVIVQDQSIPTIETTERPKTLRITADASTGLKLPGSAAIESAVPAPVDYYLVRLRGPILETWRQRLDAIKVGLIEWVPGRGYKTRLTLDQIARLKVAARQKRGDRWVQRAQVPHLLTREFPIARRACESSGS